MTFSIGELAIGAGSVTVIAEAGVNHNGSLDEAKSLALSAKECGAGIVKFQTYKSEKLSSPRAEKFWEKEHDLSVYQEETYSILDGFEEADYFHLKQFCDSIGIEFLSTPFDLDAVDMLCRIGVNGFKIASCDITNFSLIEKVAKTKLPIFLSTGASTLGEIEEAVNFISEFHRNLSLMHCVLSYPTANADANILSVDVLAKKYPDLVIGYSDHTREIYSALGSVALGSRVIEKHFTLARDNSKPGDHWFAVVPEDMKLLVEGSNAILQALGKHSKDVLDCELKAREQARRSIYLANSVSKGQLATKDDFIMLRPGTGLEPKVLDSLIGKRFVREMDKLAQVSISDLE